MVAVGEDGKLELVTPPTTSGLILPGVSLSRNHTNLIQITQTHFGASAVSCFHFISENISIARLTDLCQVTRASVMELGRMPHHNLRVVERELPMANILDMIRWQENL